MSLRAVKLSTVLIAVAVALSGCHLHMPHFHLHSAEKTAQSAPPPKIMAHAAAIMPIDLTKVQPNEAGKVMILEYHDLVVKPKQKGYQITPAEFRKDLDWLYAHNYRPINLSDYVQGRIDTPAGMSPVILTFDDALKGQFNYTADGKIDPNCAVGIMDSFHAQHPDWPLRGTFFVLTNGDPVMPPAFYQAEYAEGKMDYLVKEGFEIGNHTIHHKAGIKHWPDAQVEAEFAGAVANIHKMLPTYNVQTLALPYGVFPKNQKLVISGQSGGVKYSNICALLAGANPAPSPMAKNFKPYRLPRIIPSGNDRFGMSYWFNFIEKNKNEKYVSDGDPNTYTVNLLAKGQLDTSRLKKDHYHLRTYNGTQIVDSM